MKSKNLIPGLLVIVLAVGSAFTSVTAPVAPDYISVKYLGDQGFTCKQIQQECNLSGERSCEVTVQTTSGAKPAQVYEEASCATPLTDSRPNIGQAGDDRAIESVIAP